MPSRSVATCEQQIGQWQLNAYCPRVRTGDHEPQRVCAATVHIAGGFDVGAGVQQTLGDADNVGWCALSKILHAIRRDVVQQRRMVAAGGALFDEGGVRAQQQPQCLKVALHNGIHCLFEPGVVHSRV